MVTFRRIVSPVLVTIFIINILTTSVLFVALMFFGQFVLSKRAAQYLSCAVAWTIGHEFVFIGGWLSNVSLVLYGRDEDLERLKKGGNYLINMNHQYEIDFFTGWFFGVVTDCLTGAKVCLKEELRRVPILGKVWDGMGFIYLQREWKQDKANLDRYCNVLNDYVLPYTVLIFCEGTRFTEVKRESSNEYARSHGLKELKYHLIPRTRGFLHIMSSLRCSLNGVFDVTGRIVGAKATLFNMFYGPPMTAHCHIRHFELDTVPTDEGECTKWLYKLYEEKDELIDGFMKNGHFPGRMFPKEVPFKGMLVSTLFLIFYTLPMLYGLSLLILNLPPICLYVSVAVLFIASAALVYKIWGFSRISKASSYGLNQPSDHSNQKADQVKSD